jgi:hypothetical protein
MLPSNNEVNETEEKCICVPVSKKEDILSEEEEIVPDVKLTINVENKIQLFNLIMTLKQYGYPLTSALIYYYNYDIEEYICCGSDPVDQSIYLSLENETNDINLKVYNFIDQDFIKKISGMYTKSRGAQNDSNLNDEIDKSYVSNRGGNISKTLNKRTKERKIGYIIDKVNSWRKYYNGFYDENKTFTKYSLEDAAVIVGISKKSLDDYLLQLRLGRKFGFDFNENKHNKVGVLRTFVKKARNSMEGSMVKDENME